MEDEPGPKIETGDNPPIARVALYWQVREGAIQLHRTVIVRASWGVGARTYYRGGIARDWLAWKGWAPARTHFAFRVRRSRLLDDHLQGPGDEGRTCHPCQCSIVTQSDPRGELRIGSGGGGASCAGPGMPEHWPPSTPRGCGKRMS